MHPLAVWPAALDLQGLVDLGYQVRVRADTPPVLPDGRAGLVWLSDGTLRVCGPETRLWRPDRVGVTAVGVRLARGPVPAVLGVPATALLDQRVHLHELWGAAALELAERLSASPGAARAGRVAGARSTPDAPRPGRSTRSPLTSPAGWSARRCLSAYWRTRSACPSGSCAAGA